MMLLFRNVCYCEIDKDHFNVEFFDGLRASIINQTGSLRAMRERERLYFMRVTRDSN